ncbi:transporter substrate-binding domain-containing protein [Aestuariibacter sp. AA17]|uniref:Transporter substrate-binding domain-containing protein n=1 Tax=Fluctibacter corallii TaxID=2984329 RepID=A0ABT3A479_9ALTE|nr:transporter substrate-binding domain-containing protein [Aestuariibacter sp. AA17]MCV2883480.1 transporter substrate-binding domain-containing protein [Aestuariibacter sp. AA17]
MISIAKELPPRFIKAIVLLTALMGATTSIAATLPTDKFDGKVSVVTEHWPPYNFLDEDDNLRGSATEKLRYILDNADLDYTIEVMPWVRAYALAKNQPNTLIYSIYRTEERENLFHWFCPLAKSVPQYIFKLRNRHDIALSNIKELKDLRIGVNRDAYAHQLLIKHGLKEHEHFSTTTDVSHFLPLLLKGRVDLIVDTKSGLQQKLDKLSLPYDTVETVLTLVDDMVCVAANRQSDPQLLEALSKQFESNAAN